MPFRLQRARPGEQRARQAGALPRRRLSPAFLEGEESRVEEGKWGVSVYWGQRVRLGRREGSEMMW